MSEGLAYLKMLERDQRAVQVTEGLKAAIETYYEDFTDCVDLTSDDPALSRALERIAEYADEDLDVILAAVEDELRAQGRAIVQRDEDED